MRVLIVYTHPNHHSLSDGFLQNVIAGCQENPNVSELEVLDLYEEKFDPVLVFHENKRRRDMHRDPNLEKYRNQIRSADLLVYIYPIWWGRPPAMLLGYFDQVFATNFAYRYKGRFLSEGF